MGEAMALDEKMIGDEMYTVLSNRQTGKIAMLAETMEINELKILSQRIGDTAKKVKYITCDLSPSYDTFCHEAYPGAMRIADKFHVIRHTVESVQSIRIRLKQEEMAKLSKDKKVRKQQEQETIFATGESRREMLTRSRYLLFKMSKTWTASQQKRASLLFKTYPVLEKAYKLSEEIRLWYDRANIGKGQLVIEKQLYEWYEKVEDENIPEMNNLMRLFIHNEEKILNYFKTGKTNAQAEAVNGRIQRFITANYGIRDKDFFLYRLAKYFS